MLHPQNGDRTLTIDFVTSLQVSVLLNLNFYPRDAMIARVLAMALCPCLCVSVCLSQVGVLLKWLDRSRWFLAWMLLSTSVFYEIRVSTKIGVLPSGTFS